MTDEEILGAVEDRTPHVKKVMELIRSEFMPRGKFTADDVYMHESEPKDLDMYLALGFMVEKGELLAAPDHMKAPTHTEMTYEVPT